MSTKKKIIITSSIAVPLLIIAGVAAYYYIQSGIQKVTTGRAVRQDLTAVVSGTGQIKPKTYVNIGATSFGRITHLYVKEGDRVKMGDILARVESVQPEATVDAQAATIASSRTDIASYIAAENTASGQHRPGQGRPRAEEAGLRSRPAALRRPADRQAGLRRQEGRV